MQRLIIRYLLFLNLFCFILIGCSKNDSPPPPPPSSEKSLNAVVFKAADNPGLQEDITGTIVGDSMKVKLPSSVSLTALVPTIDYTGASITPANRTPQNFTNAVTYKITAQDGSARNYSFNSTYRTFGDTTAMIIAKWSIIKDSVTNINYAFPNNCGSPNSGVYFGIPGDYFEFNANGIVSQFGNNNFSSAPYQILPTARISINSCFNYECAIQYLTPTRLTLFWAFTSSVGGQYSRTLYLKK